MKEIIKLCKLWCSALISTILFFAVPVTGSEVESDSKNLPHRIPTVSSKATIDGVLDEKVWEEALVLTLNYEVEPGENIRPPVKTEVLLAYGSNRLYVAFRAYDPNPADIRARFTDNDKIWDDDYVGIVLDTFNDSRRTYNFYCNPYGVQADQIDSSVGVTVEWDAIWDSAGKISKEGYIVEMNIPFSSLRFQRKKGEQIWGIDAVRYYPRSLSHLIGLFPRDRSNSCYICQAEKVIGFKDAKPGRSLEFDPTLSAIFTQERENFPEGKFVKKTGKGDPGLTARWSFTPNLTLGATVNPDFSQVEADVAQLDINTQFALFYPEKRSFFLEGASLFDTYYNIVYTRTLADPNWGIKLTGKEGGNAIGFFSVQDNITNLLIPGSQSSDSTSLAMNNISSVLRYRRDIGKSSILGIVLTDREGEDYFNRIAGIDGYLRFTKKDRIWFQFLGSQTRYPDQVASEYGQPQENFTGSALYASYRHMTKNVLTFFDHQRITPNFRGDLGFFPKVGYKYYIGWFEYHWLRNPGYWYTRLTLGNHYELEKDFNNNLLFKAYKLWFNYFGSLQSKLVLVLNIGKRAFMGTEFDENYLNFMSQIRPSGSLDINFNGTIGDRIDFANVQAGTRVLLNPNIQYKIGRHLSFGLDHIFERLKVNGGRLYTANISNIRLVYQFSRRTFLRTILQYVNYDYNANLYTFPIDPKFRHWFTQILFSYKINPQTVLFLGYSSDYYGYQNIPVTQNNRTLFLKIGYALVL